MIELLGMPAVFLVIILIRVFLRFRRAGRLNSGWRTFAAAHSLEFTPMGVFDEPAISGNVDGHDLKVGMRSVKQGRSRWTYTALELKFRSQLPLSVSFTGRADDNRLFSAFAEEGPEVFSQEFHQEILTERVNFVDLESFLTDARAAAILRVFQSHSWCKVDENGLRLSKDGWAESSTEMENLFVDALNLAISLTEQVPAPAREHWATTD